MADLPPRTYVGANPYRDKQQDQQRLRARARDGRVEGAGRTQQHGLMRLGCTACQSCCSCGRCPVASGIKHKQRRASFAAKKGSAHTHQLCELPALIQATNTKHTAAGFMQQRQPDDKNPQNPTACHTASAPAANSTQLHIPCPEPLPCPHPAGRRPRLPCSHPGPGWAASRGHCHPAGPHAPGTRRLQGTVTQHGISMGSTAQAVVNNALHVGKGCHSHASTGTNSAALAEAQQASSLDSRLPEGVGCQRLLHTVLQAAALLCLTPVRALQQSPPLPVSKYQTSLCGCSEWFVCGLALPPVPEQQQH